MDAIVREMDSPISAEFRRAQREMELGLPLVEALQQLHDRLPSNDLVLLASAVGVQHRVGGDLSPVLNNLSHTIRERQRLRGEVNVLTAQARYSAMVVGALPILLFAFLFLTNYAYLSNLFRPGMNLLLVLGVGMEALGFVLMRRMATVEA
jgi:tight adherence protein B